MLEITLGKEGGSSDQERHEKRCLTYCNSLGLHSIYIGVFIIDNSMKYIHICISSFLWRCGVLQYRKLNENTHTNCGKEIGH